MLDPDYSCYVKSQGNQGWYSLKKGSAKIRSNLRKMINFDQSSGPALIGVHETFDLIFQTIF